MTTTEVQKQEPPKLPVDLDGPLSGLDEAYRMAQALAQSSLVPDELRNKASNVLVTVLYGRELGLAPMQSIQSIHVIKGKPFISGQLWLSLVRRAGHKASVSGDAASATCTISRADTGEEHTETFTMAHAEQAGLAPGKPDSNWTRYPDRMLRWRAVANCARMICPEIALGFSASEERADDTQPTRTLAEVARQRDAEPVDAELVDDGDPDDRARRQRDAVDALAAQHAPPNVDTATGEVYEPTDDVLADMAREMAAERDDTPASGLFGGDS